MNLSAKQPAHWSASKLIFHLSNSAAKLEPKSDIYSFGATLHFLLTGEDPEPLSVSNPRLIKPEVVRCSSTNLLPSAQIWIVRSVRSARNFGNMQTPDETVRLMWHNESVVER